MTRYRLLTDDEKELPHITLSGPNAAIVLTAEEVHALLVRRPTTTEGEREDRPRLRLVGRGEGE